MECTYSVTLRRIRVTIVSVEKSVSVTHFECVCVCRLSYLACNVHARVLVSYVASAVLFHSIW
jgi:hypothetical protein